MNTVLYAQSLDNASPSKIKYNGNMLNDNESELRKDAFHEISTIIAEGKCIFKENHIRITTKENSVVVEVPSKELDNANRISPLICHIKHEADWIETGDTIISELKQFSAQIGRNIDEKNIDLIKNNFLINLNEKQQPTIPFIKRHKAKIIAAAIAFVTGAAIVAAIFSETNKLNK